MIMVELWDGTLSSAEFYAAASAFSEQWRKFHSFLPHWTWIPSSKRPWVSHDTNQEGYLSMENVILPGLPEKDFSKGDPMEEQDYVCEYDDDFADAAIIVRKDDPVEHRYDFHAVYSDSFRVPVLYFRAYRNDGQPLLLDDIENDITANAAQQLTRSKWTFITQEEHPHLNRPWYTLHPCGTSEWMRLLSSSDTSSSTQGITPVEKYLVSWFSVVGQVFGLKIPLDMLHLAVTHKGEGKGFQKRLVDTEIPPQCS